MILPDLAPLWLTLKLAALVSVLLLILSTPLAWWLARSRARLVPLVEALTALPLVLPPTVIGFYLLIAFRPDAPFGAFWMRLTGDTLTFSFAGLVLASLIYSLPFAVQPLQAAFTSLGSSPMEAASSLRAGPLAAFLTVALPLSARGYLTAAVLTFAHTLGEFGVVLMVGGNIPGPNTGDFNRHLRTGRAYRLCRRPYPFRPFAGAVVHHPPDPLRAERPGGAA